MSRRSATHGPRAPGAVRRAGRGPARRSPRRSVRHRAASHAGGAGATGVARLSAAASPFGIGVTAGRPRAYDSGSPRTSCPARRPRQVHRLRRLGRDARSRGVGPARRGAQRRLDGRTGRSSTSSCWSSPPRPTRRVDAHAGPTVLHGTSPSGWLQSFLTHPLFRGIAAVSPRGADAPAARRCCFGQQPASRRRQPDARHGGSMPRHEGTTLAWRWRCRSRCRRGW